MPTEGRTGRGATDVKKPRASKQARRERRKARQARRQQSASDSEFPAAAERQAERRVSNPERQRHEARESFLEQAHDHTPYLGVFTDEGRFVIFAGKPAMVQHLFLRRSRPEFRVLRRAVTAVEALLGDDAIADRDFIDIGANIGTATIAALRSHRFAAAICCEPEEESHRLLRVNAALNDFDDRIRALRVAASNRVGRSYLVVPGRYAGKAWVAVDANKLEEVEDARAQRAAERGRSREELAELDVAEIDTVTLDHLANTGVIEPDRVGMLWMDAEGHEGNILEGAGRLTGRGTPIVLEFHPSYLRRRGDAGMVQTVAQRSYTHFLDLRRRPADLTQRRFQLQPVSELPRLADRLLEPATRVAFTDLLLLRLTSEQLDAGDMLAARLRRDRRD